MAVLVEGLSVVVKCGSKERKLSGGMPAFLKGLPNESLCSDGRLAAVSFRTPLAVKKFVDFLETGGLVFKSKGTSEDIVVLDQHKGPTIACSWIKFGRTSWQGDPDKPISVCSFDLVKGEEITVPVG